MLVKMIETKTKPEVRLTGEASFSGSPRKVRRLIHVSYPRIADLGEINTHGYGVFCMHAYDLNDMLCGWKLNST